MTSRLLVVKLQAITRIIADLLSIRPYGAYSNDISLNIQEFWAK